MEFVKCGGRKLWALKRLRLLSLVSWRQMTEGAAATSAFLTIAHLSGSSNPRTFQDTTRKFLKPLHILKPDKSPLVPPRSLHSLAQVESGQLGAPVPPRLWFPLLPP